MAEPLSIWMYEMEVATVELDRRRLRLRYTRQALDSFPRGLPLLSSQLRLGEEPYPNAATRDFLDGLLPEGDPRRAIADSLGLRADDTFGLTLALGRDCAGALVIQPSGEGPPPTATVLTAERLSENDVGELVANLRSAPLGADSRTRISLGGVQEKLLLTRLPDGGWGRPVDGTPSTHILKPEIQGFPHTVENEAFCMRLARHLGLAVADVETGLAAGRKLLVVRRYDRTVEPDGAVRRVHQEDLGQATGTPPSRKYEEDGGPSLRTFAGLLSATDPDSLPTLLAAATLNVAIGNGDAHAKNFSLLHDRSGALRLAPLYDLLSTFIYGDKRLAMYVDSVQRTDRVTHERLLNEAASWGMSRTTATATVAELLERLPTAVERAASETPGVPAELLELISTQRDRLQSRPD